jgi:SAM-dependent methyltransferase
VRRFSPEYLRRTRNGLWEDRTALAPLDLPERDRVLDVGAGTGELTRVLAEEAPPGATVAALDADAELLDVVDDETGLPALRGDATRLPVADGAFDLVVCQALLVNLPAPGRAVRAFARASSDLVAAVEPDNAAVGVDSTVAAEVELERRARRAYLDGVDTDVAPGERVADLFREAGLSDVRTRRHHHEKRVEPPYDDGDVRAAARKASGDGLAAHEAELRRALADEAYDALRAEWREMGREVVDRMGSEEYRRVEVVPFDVTVGRV